MKSKLTFLSVFIFSFLFSFAQNYTHIYYFDAAFKTADQDKALIIGQGVYEADHFKLDCFLAKSDVLLYTMHFKDSSLESFEGEYVEYHNGRKVAERGYYKNNVKEGAWQNWDTLGRKTDSVLYAGGIWLKHAAWSYITEPEKNNFRKYSYEITDSLANTFDREYYSDSGTVSGQVHFIGQSGTWKHYNKDGTTTIDTLYTRKENEAAFPGGTPEWTKYLEKSLGYFNPADYGAKAGIYKVIVKFIVDKDGSISDIRAETRFGYRMESTVIKIIKDGPRWEPARQFGKPIKAYRLQPVTFWVEAQ